MSQKHGDATITIRPIPFQNAGDRLRPFACLRAPAAAGQSEVPHGAGDKLRLRGGAEGAGGSPECAADGAGGESLPQTQSEYSGALYWRDDVSNACGRLKTIAARFLMTAGIYQNKEGSSLNSCGQVRSIFNHPLTRGFG